jgi:pyrimidine-nucleoside phosphorylase
MKIVDLIVKKRESEVLTKEEIDFFIDSYTKCEIPDYQVSALLMSIMLNGMNSQETTDLTLAMANSGDILDLSGIVDVAVDKHSTGGVGDKTTLVVGPIAAACGLPVGKMSGRGLGFSGGTLDKMESITGYRTDLTTKEFLSQLKNKKIVLAGQSADLAPADGKLYALRDVTGTVPSMPLIASSIMSKKIAAGAQKIVLDVKLGNGAFMENLEEARELAEIMVKIGKLAGRETVAVLSDMNQPLGHAVGNALEVVEAVETLQGGGPKDFVKHCHEIAIHMLMLGGVAASEEEAREKVFGVISDGSAWSMFKELVVSQGGDVIEIKDTRLLPKAKFIETVRSPFDGYIAEVNARKIGELSVNLGAGREKKGDPVDHAVGVVVHTKVGDKVQIGDPLFTIHVNKENLIELAKKEMMDAHKFSDAMVNPLPLFYGVVK